MASRARSRFRKWFAAWIVGMVVAGLAACAAPFASHAPAATSTPTNTPSPTATPQPATVSEIAVSDPTGSIVAAPDGRVWYGAGTMLNSISPSGTRGPAVAAGGTIFRVVLGPEQRPWALVHSNNGGWLFVRVAADGAATSFPVPANYQVDFDYLIAGSDGALWYLAHSFPVADSSGQFHINSVIGRITASGQSQQFPVPQANLIGLDFITPSTWIISGNWMTVGSDHRIWMLMTHEVCKQESSEASCAESGPEIVAVSASGAIHSYALPAPSTYAYGVVSGPDGNLWTTLGAKGSGQIVIFSTSGASRVLPLPDGLAADDMAFAPDGSLWFTVPDVTNAYIGHITPQGTVTKYVAPVHALRGNIPQDAFQANSILLGPDGDIWFTERPYAYVGHLAPGATTIREVSLPDSTKYHISVVGDLIAAPNSTLWYTRNYFNDPPNNAVAAGIGVITP